MDKQTVYLVKFNLGYYAKKQPEYHWSYTDDPYLATHYKTMKAAKERALWGVGLMPAPDKVIPESYIIEEYNTVTTMELVAQ